MFVSSCRNVVMRAQAAAGWLRAFVFLEDGRPGKPPAVSDWELSAPDPRATRTDHVSTSRSQAHGPVDYGPDRPLRVQTAAPRPASHVHRRPVRPVRRARRPGEAAPRPMPCLTPLPARPVAPPAISRRAVARRLAP